MKYKLKRDLPFVKTSPYPQDNEGLEIIELKDKFIVKFTDCNYYIWQTDIPKNNAHMWIEEAKPREWYVLECENPGLLWESEAIKAQLRKNPNLKFIKVREIL